jgi:serine protease inhibitor
LHNRFHSQFVEEADMKFLIPGGLAAALLFGSLVGGVDKPEASPVIRGNNAFAFDLYAHLAGQKGNLFFSPYSVSTALAMTYAGARGQTAIEMCETLHFPLPQEELHPAFARLLKEMDGKDKNRPFEMHIANALWGQKDYGFLNELLEVTKTNYGAGLREVDFVKDTEGARQTINRWVEEQTNDKIKELIQPRILDSDTRLVLTNAIYYKAPWQTPFSEGRTKEGEFHVTSDQKVMHPIMHQTGEFKYLDVGEFQLLDMPYKGYDQSMVVLLPKKTDGLAELEKTLTAQNLENWLTKGRERQVDVTFPRFKFMHAFELNKKLADMGMPDAFTPDADFSGMNGRKDLSISNVIHQAFVDVHEKGTEAAAATAVVMARASAPPEPPAKFQADHPFVFVIRDNRTGSILFLGRVINPDVFLCNHPR